MPQDEVDNLLTLHSGSVRTKIQQALDWSKKYKTTSSSESEDIRKKAALVLFHEMVFHRSTTIGEMLCHEASVDILDIIHWLRDNFNFLREDVYTMLTTWMKLGAKELPFSPFGLNSKYEIMQEAAFQGDVDLIQWLLQNNVEVDARDSDDRTALHVAAENGHQELVSFLLENGASIFRIDNSKQTPFHKAFDKGHFDTADMLSPHLFLGRNENAENSLLAAARDGSTKKVKYIMMNIYYRNEFIGKALSVAASKGYFAVIETVIKLYPIYLDDPGLIDNLLYLAAEGGHAVTVELLLSVGARIDQITRDTAQNNISILKIFEKYEKTSDGSQTAVLSSFSEDRY